MFSATMTGRSTRISSAIASGDADSASATHCVITGVGDDVGNSIAT